MQMSKIYFYCQVCKRNCISIIFGNINNNQEFKSKICSPECKKILIRTNIYNYHLYGHDNWHLFY
jgi:hypothetical protein